MTRPFRLRLLRSTALTAVPAGLMLLASSGQVAVAQPTTGWALNSYGLPGGVDTPSAEMLPDGEIGFSASWSTYGQRTTGFVQVLPQVTAALRYSRLDGIDKKAGFLKDRSADVRVQLLSESGSWRPALAVGMQDFMGTGVYSGEYVVATKTIGERLTVSAGLGWGRLAGKARDFPYGDEGGKFNAKDWFTGDAKPFGSVAWQATDRLRLVAEYSNDNYSLEVEQGEDEPGSKFNFGASYRFGDSYQVSAYSLGGETFGAQFSVALNMRKATYPSGLEAAPAPVRPRPAPGADPEGWSGAWSADPTAQPAIQEALGKALRDEGQVLEAMALDATRAEVRIDNRRYTQQAEAIGRTARLMTRALPPSVETFVITSTERGVPTSSVVLRRSDVERLENTEAGRIAAAATVIDAAPRVAGMVPSPGVYPRFNWNLRPTFGFSAFDNNEERFYTVNARLEASYEFRPGIVVSGALQKQLFGNTDDSDPPPLTAPYRVRSDGRLYAAEDGLTVEKLTFAWYAKPTEAIYTRFTVGMLETMYGGVSAEVLWKPVNSNLALGAEVNRVRKRDYDKLFTFQDYEVTTGHVSAYYDFGSGYLAQLDAGRYLAQDWGATLTLTREFANGWKVGGYVTKTDLSEEEFGEGSFDKGVIVSVPMAWAVGTPTRKTVGGTLRSIVRDGGARLRVDGRLYDTIHESDGGRLYQGWGRFWR